MNSTDARCHRASRIVRDERLGRGQEFLQYWDRCTRVNRHVAAEAETRGPGRLLSDLSSDASQAGSAPTLEWVNVKHGADRRGKRDVIKSPCSIGFEISEQSCRNSCTIAASSQLSFIFSWPVCRSALFRPFQRTESFRGWGSFDIRSAVDF